MFSFCTVLLFDFYETQFSKEWKFAKRMKNRNTWKCFHMEYPLCKAPSSLVPLSHDNYALCFQQAPVSSWPAEVRMTLVKGQRQKGDQGMHRNNDWRRQTWIAKQSSRTSKMGQCTVCHSAYCSCLLWQKQPTAASELQAHIAVAQPHPTASILPCKLIKQWENNCWQTSLLDSFENNNNDNINTSICWDSRTCQALEWALEKHYL